MASSESVAAIETIRSQLSTVYDAIMGDTKRVMLHAFENNLILYARHGCELEEYSAHLNRLYEIAFPPLNTAAGEDVSFIRRIHDAVSPLPYPSGYSVSPHWDRISKTFPRMALLLHDLRYVVYSGQGPHSGFDHRIDHNTAEITGVINYKAQIVKQDYDVDLFDSSERDALEESAYSIPTSVVEVRGRKYSSMFLTHYQQFKRIEKNIGRENIRRVMEIGGGYGGLARIFGGLIDDMQYVIIDLMGSLVFSYAFLRLNFPDAQIVVVDSADPNPAALAQAAFILVPVQFVQTVKHLPFDVVINTGSLQEMNQPTVDFFMNYIENELDAKYFYSFNYFLTLKQKHRETSGHDDPNLPNLICPNVSSKWVSVFARLNTPGLVFDNHSRNYLEILLKKDSAAQPEQRAVWHLAKAQQHAVMTDGWFHHALSAVLAVKNPIYIQHFLDGVRLFMTSECSIPNFTFDPKTAPDTKTVQNAYDNLGEVRYLRALL